MTYDYVVHEGKRLFVIEVQKSAARSCWEARAMSGLATVLP